MNGLSWSVRILGGYGPPQLPSGVSTGFDPDLGSYTPPLEIHPNEKEKNGKGEGYLEYLFSPREHSITHN